MVGQAGGGGVKELRAAPLAPAQAVGRDAESTLVYQVGRQDGVITITPQDISNSSTLQTVAQNLTIGVPVKVFGVPQVDGSLKAYVLVYYTHTISTE